jgi:post-segregation antitoxin (ccd killing protein)
MCWVTPIIVKGKLLEQCHLQDTNISIQDQIAINSDRWHKATEQWEKNLLHMVNNELRKYI